MKTNTISLLLLTAVLSACSTTTQTVQPTAACPMAGIYVGKSRWYLNAIHKMDVPTKMAFMPDGIVGIVTMQFPKGSGALPIRGSFTSATRFYANVPKKKILFTTVIDAMEVEAQFSPDGKSVTAYSRVAGKRAFENSGTLYKIGTPQAAEAEKQWPSLLANMKNMESKPSNVNLDEFYVENSNTATQEQLKRARFFYGQFFVMSSDSYGTTLYPLMGYLPDGQPTSNLGSSPVTVRASDIGIRPQYQIINVPRNNPIFSVNWIQAGNFAKSPMLPY